METPSSTRRVTRSQTKTVQAALSSNIPVSRKMEDSEKTVSKSRPRNGKQQERSVLIDITNDSPIVGLASGKVETPSSWMAKQRGSRIKNTPGSGEALLRGQVKTLLQKVEEEAELSKMSMEGRPFLPLVNSPIGILAPTPANTPQIPNLSPLPSSLTPLVVQVEQHSVSEVVNQASPEHEKNQLTKSLLLDFSEKSESEMTFQEVGGEGKDKPTTEDDEASIWSIQVNASTPDEDDEEIDDDEQEDYYEEDEGFVDELCEGLNKMSVNERVAPKFEGKHTRFVYDSDDELVGEEEEEEEKCSGESIDVASPSLVRLKGLPTPKGKHLRFPEEEEDK